MVGSFLDSYLEMMVGCTAIVAFCLDCMVAENISDNLSRSNRLRELYDCKVLQIEENPFFYCEEVSTIEEDLKIAEGRPDSSKYPVWYRETFSDDEFKNSICLIMDNVIYTYYIYAEYRKRILIKLGAYAAFFSVYSLCYITVPHAVMARLINPLILFAAVFDNVKDLVSNYMTSKELEETNRQLKENVMKQHTDIVSQKGSPEERDSYRKRILRSLEDVIIRNRDSSLFIPKSIRNKYLVNGNPYYKELDRVKNLFWQGTTLTKPVAPEDYEIPSIENEDVTVTLKNVHDELMCMLLDVKSVLDQAGIQFLLDGGTLIGSIREPHKGFLPWDDDIDLSLRSCDVESAIAVIQEQLGDKYVIQDVSSETYYSPRLSRFRIRQKNEKSAVTEKDSELYELYQSRGLFLDIYAYSPILVNRTVDKIYRRLFIYTLYQRIRATETAWKYRSQSVHHQDRYLKRFVKQRRRFQRRTSWYLRHAKCTDYYSYIPGYIEDIRKTGPYLEKEALYGKKRMAEFEGHMFEVPSKPDKVLLAFYGENWNRSPYRSLESLKEAGEYAFSADTFDASNYKHVKNVSLYNARNDQQ